jgi:transcriptional regulator with XRE-family HTH domain
MKKLNERIKKIRNDLHLSQQYVADYVGINRSAIAEIESGKRNVSAAELDLFSKLFLISTDELLHGTKTSAPQATFARKFDQLDEEDQIEILNLIEFKKQMKSKRG